LNDSPAESIGIEPRAYRTMRAVEDSHWWFDGMEAITARLLDKAGIKPDARLEILDAGCGTGRNLAFLARYGRVTGVDYSMIALECCRERGLTRLVRGSVNAFPLADDSFDLVTSFDVLTARAVDDRAALAEAARVLRPGGWLLLRVAAYDWLRGRHDDEWAIGHRYRRGPLRAKLADAGLTVERVSYANSALLPAVMLKRLAEGLFGPGADGSDLEIGANRSLVARGLYALLAKEATLVAGVGLPFGLSLFALARKPG
jgi:SAM-dependent methyltransferase